MKKREIRTMPPAAAIRNAAPSCQSRPPKSSPSSRARAPAARRLSCTEVGPGRLAATLRLAGVPLEFPHHHWAAALPLALGGVGITLRDLAMLYSGLASDGRATPLRVLQDFAVVPASPLMTKASAHMIAVHTSKLCSACRLGFSVPMPLRPV